MSSERTEVFYREIIKAFDLKDFVKNIDHRIFVLERCAQSRQWREEQWVICSRDPLYWINTFCCLMEPRSTGGAVGKIPFITFEFQDDVLRKIFNCIDPMEFRDTHENKDIWIMKCRDMGVSWLCVAAFVHSWIFRDYKSFAFLSYKRDLADQKSNSDSLYYKVAFFLKCLPIWMQPVSNAVGGVFTNEERHNTISAEATIENAFRGGRKTGIFCDEFPACKPAMQSEIMSSSQSACSFRVFNGTPKVNWDAFWKRCSNPQGNNTEVVRLHWTLDPRKTKGYYKNRKGQERSLWYDEELAKAENPEMFERETCMKPVGDAESFFSHDKIIDPYIEKAEPPIFVGDIVGNELIPNMDGAFISWMTPNQIKGQDIVIGCDVSFGSGATNSVAAGWNKTMTKKLFMYVVSNMEPSLFAGVVNWLGTYFSPNGTAALVNWETAGPGDIFSRRLIELGYPNLYRRVKTGKYTEEQTEFLGYAMSMDSKIALLAKYNQFLTRGWAENKDIDSIRELAQFCYKRRGQGDKLAVEYHSGGADNDATANKPHGDRVMADALAVWTMDSLKFEPQLRNPEKDFQEMMAKRRFEVNRGAISNGRFGALHRIR